MTTFQAQTSAPTSGLSNMYTNVDLQKPVELALQLFVKGQEHDKANSAHQIEL